MNLRFLTALLVLAIGGAFSGAIAAESKIDYHIVKKIPLGGEGFWDYLTIDSAARRLYIGRTNRLMVVDMNTDKLVGEIEGLNGAHGAAIVPEFNCGFITSGKDDTVRVFNLKTLQETARVKAGPKPDAIIYDTATKRVFAFNGGGTTATAIDAATAKAIGTVELGGQPEFAVVDGHGKVFVNLEDKNQVAVFDSKQLAVSAHWPVSPGEEPTGLALDGEHRRLFSGCHNNIMAILDADNGKVVAHVPIGAGVDATGFDPESQNAFSSNGSGSLTVIHEDNPDTFTVVQNVETQKGARTMSVDPKTHQIWLVTATLEAASNATVPQNRQHKVVKPGTFTALVVGK